MADQKELARFSKQMPPVLGVPPKDEFEELEGILGVCWMAEVIVWCGLRGCEPIVGKRDWVSCGCGELAAQGSMIGLVFPDAVTISICSSRMTIKCLTFSTHPRG